MKIDDKTVRTINIYIEPYEINNLIFNFIKQTGNNLYKDVDIKDVELKYDFVKEGSPEYITGKIKCKVTIIKEIPNAHK